MTTLLHPILALTPSDRIPHTTRSNPMSTAPLTPEQQAQGATRIAWLEQEIARQEQELHSLQTEQFRIKPHDRQEWEARYQNTASARQRNFEEVNAIRARLGLPVVIPPQLAKPETLQHQTARQGGCLSGTFWGLTLLGSLLGGVILVIGVFTANGAPQEAAAAAIALGCAVIPYCVARAISELTRLG